MKAFSCLTPGSLLFTSHQEVLSLYLSKIFDLLAMFWHDEDNFTFFFGGGGGWKEGVLS